MITIGIIIGILVAIALLLWSFPTNEDRQEMGRDKNGELTRKKLVTRIGAAAKERGKVFGVLISVLGYAAILVAVFELIPEATWYWEHQKLFWWTQFLILVAIGLFWYGNGVTVTLGVAAIMVAMMAIGLSFPETRPPAAKTPSVAGSRNFIPHHTFGKFFLDVGSGYTSEIKPPKGSVTVAMLDRQGIGIDSRVLRPDGRVWVCKHRADSMNIISFGLFTSLWLRADGLPPDEKVTFAITIRRSTQVTEEISSFAPPECTPEKRA